MINYWIVLTTDDYITATNILIFEKSAEPSLFHLVLSIILSIFMFLLATKFKSYDSMKKKFSLLLFAMFQVIVHYLWFVTAPIIRSVVPYLEDRFELSKNTDIVWYQFLLGNNEQLMLIIKYAPLFVTLLFIMFLVGLYNRDHEEIKDAFRDYEINSKFFKNIEQATSTQQTKPDVILGPDSKTEESVILHGGDRTLGTAIVGSIGTGKTSALLIPLINQDLHHLVRFINEYPKIRKLPNFETEEIRGSYLNGITIIEPSNDLCQKAYKLVLAHGIPKEAVFYIDPTNPNTPSINPMKGPTGKVAEAFASVIEGLAESGSGGGLNFFQQSERNHLKEYIYLLKEHDVEFEPTFSDLIDMYNDPMLVRAMHVKLKERLPMNINDIEDRDERNNWHILKGIDDWFEMNHKQATTHNGSPEKFTTGKYRGQVRYYDAKEEHVQNLRNVLNDISNSVLIRRVLFGKSEFNWDAHLASGGVLLVNTAKGELATLSNIIGKLVLLSIQNAVFRRTPMTSTFHHLIADEFADFMYQSFREFPAQARKYKAVITVATQSVTQLADRYGEMYMHTLLGTLRNKFVYADIPNYDAELFSKIFGEETKFEETTTEQGVPITAENPQMRQGSSYKKSKEAIMSPNDILMQKEFHCAVKMVKNNRSMPVRQIKANFINDEEYDEAIIKVDPKAAAIWLEDRNKDLFGISNDENVAEPLEELVLEVEEQVDEVTIEPTLTSNNVIPMTLPNVEPKEQPGNEYKMEIVTKRNKLRTAGIEDKLLFSDLLVQDPQQEKLVEEKVVKEMPVEDQTIVTKTPEEVKEPVIIVEQKGPIELTEEVKETIITPAINESAATIEDDVIMDASTLLGLSKKVEETKVETIVEESITAPKAEKSELGKEQIDLVNSLYTFVNETEEDN